jgi:hypothetical protein
MTARNETLNSTPPAKWMTSAAPYES